MTDEEIKLRRLSYAIEEDMNENELFEIARERRYRINDLEKENAELNGLKFELQDREHAYSVLLEENEKLKQRITELVTAFNNYECAGPEQEQENTWEILRDKMHREIRRLEGKDRRKQSMSELDGL